MIPLVGQDAKRVALDTSAASLTVAASKPRSVDIRNASAATPLPGLSLLAPAKPYYAAKTAILGSRTNSVRLVEGASCGEGAATAGLH